MYDGHMFGFGFGFMWLFWLLLIVVVILVVRAIAGGGAPPSAPRNPALEILKERYAKGEIDQTEFEQKRKDLGE